MEIKQVNIKIKDYYLESYKVVDFPGKFVISLSETPGDFDIDDYIIKVCQESYPDLELFPCGYRDVKMVKEIVPIQKVFDWC